MCKESEQKKLKPEEDYTTYLLEMDKDLVEQWANDKNTSISFRQAGEETLKCLKRGAGAKPHSILDKTLKLKQEPKNNAGDNKASADGQNPIKTHNDAVNDFFKDFPEDFTEAKNLLMGLVGHWQNGVVDGLYLTCLGKQKFEKRKGCDLGKNGNEMPYLKLENKDQKKALKDYFDELEGTGNRKLYLFNRLFFSGDYDVHDLLQAGKPVPTSTDMILLEDLQQMMMERRIEYLQKNCGVTDGDIAEENKAQKLPDGKFAKDYCRIQHGPQANYTAQMLNENVALMNKISNHLEESKKHNKPADINVIVDSVASMDYPVCLYDGAPWIAKWKVLASEKDICDYYTSKGLVPKITWVDEKARKYFSKWVIRTSIQTLYPHATKEQTKDILQNLEKDVPGFKAVYGNNYTNAVMEVLNEMIAAGILK